MIPVTKPFLPGREEFDKYVDEIWERNWLTNNGPLVNELELQLKKALHLQHLLYVTNGTIAIQLAIKALNLKGKIITTPFSYVATTSSIVWEACEPVYVDIDPNTLNIDATKIENAITSDTVAILPTHVYGIPCDVDAISKIAKMNNLKVIYDAAHAYGVEYKGKSIFLFGDISTASFHATKLFHTTEGGAVVTSDSDILKKLSVLRNFGHTGPENFGGIGINGKNSEFHAAMGLAVLPHVDEIIKKRKNDSELYDKWLLKVDEIRRPIIPDRTAYNYSYYPIILKTESLLEKVVYELNRSNVFPRRYFYPDLTTLPYIHHNYDVPVTENISRRVLCLPLYYDLHASEIDMISRIIIRTIKYA